MKTLTTHEKARLMKLIKEGKEAVSRIESNLMKVSARLEKQRAA